MKRLSVILIMLMYGFASSGMTVQLHFCCGKLKKVNWVAQPIKNCGNDLSMKGKKCCETLKISPASDLHEKVFSSLPVKEEWSAALPSTALLSSSPVLLFTTFRPAAHAYADPPDPVPAFLRFCVFRL